MYLDISLKNNERIEIYYLQIHKLPLGNTLLVFLTYANNPSSKIRTSLRLRRHSSRTWKGTREGTCSDLVEADSWRWTSESHLRLWLIHYCRCNAQQAFWPNFTRIGKAQTLTMALFYSSVPVSTIMHYYRCLKLNGIQPSLILTRRNVFYEKGCCTIWCRDNCKSWGTLLLYCAVVWSIMGFWEHCAVVEQYVDTLVSLF